MNYSVSDTAEYGGMSRGIKIITDETREEMKRILKNVQNGTFAEEWIKENRDGQPLMERLRTETKNHPIEKIGLKLRQMMDWLPSNDKLETPA